MRYILDNEGWIEEVSFGGEIICNNNSCTEYTGSVPSGYVSLQDWFDNANIRAYKIESGNLVYDSDRDSELQALWETENLNNTSPTRTEISNNYYNKEEVDEKMEGFDILEKIDGKELVVGSVIGWDSDKEIPEGYEEVETVSVNSAIPVGAGMDYYGKTAPENWLFADGSAISRTEYSELFSIIGTTYGAGDGSTTFNLPDKRERVSISANPSLNGADWYPGKTGGSIQHRHTQAGYTGEVFLSEAQIPGHTHTISTKVVRYSHVGKGGNWTGPTQHFHMVGQMTDNLTAQYDSNEASFTYNHQIEGQLKNGYTGGGNGHAHTLGSTDLAYALPPYLVCNYIIKVKNEYVSTYDIISRSLGGAY